MVNGEIASNSIQAINGTQMYNVIQPLENESNSFKQFEPELNHNRKVAVQGIASAMAKRPWLWVHITCQKQVSINSAPQSVPAWVHGRSQQTK